MPEISVIVPVYNAQPFLKKCTDSILNQTFRDLELLLIDDGSTDESAILCDAIAGEDPRVRVFHKENGGVSSARNLGMKEATGQFLAFADADDWLETEALQWLYTYAQQADADTAGCAHYCTQPTGELTVEPGAMPLGTYTQEEIREGIVNRLLGERLGKSGEILNGFIWRFLFSRNIIIEHDITFSGAYLEDELFLLEYFCYAQRLAMTDRALYYYLQNPDSVTRNYLPNYMDTFRAFMRAKQELAEKHQLDIPLWRENSSWAGLLIAVGNEFAPGNRVSFGTHKRNIRALTKLPEMSRAIRVIRPKKLDRNKQIVANMLCHRKFFRLTLLYTMKNRKHPKK